MAVTERMALQYQACHLYYYCATQICIVRTCYGDVAGWLAVRHTLVLYQNC